MGQYQFNNVPVIVKSFDYTYEANIDYVSVYTASNVGYSDDIGVALPQSGPTPGFTQVPTHLSVRLELDTQYVPIKIRNNLEVEN